MDRDYDAQLLDSSTPSSLASLSPKQASISTTSCLHKFILFLISLLLIFCVGIEMVAFKSTATAFPFSACFVICFFLICHSLSCFMICLYQIYIVSTYTVSILSSFPFGKYLPMAVLRGLSISIIFIAISREIEGSLLIIIMQTATPLSILMSRFVSSISIHSISRGHWTAIVLTFVALIFGFIASFLGNLGSHYIDYKDNGDTQNAWWYTAIAFGAIFPHALSILYGEIKLSSYAQQYPQELIHGFVSLMQCFVSMILSPILIYLSDPEPLFWSDWYTFLHEGFVCLFSDRNGGTMYCPNGHIQSVIQFVAWLIMSILVQLLTAYILTRTTPFIQRFCVLIGLLFAFVCFQMGFPSILIVGDADAFDECLLLGVLCSFVGSGMLLIDFNPTRSNTLLDSIQLQDSTKQKMQSDLLSLKQQHDSLSMSQQEIKIETISHNKIETISHKHIGSKSLQQIYLEPNEHEDATDYVSYLLMEQQKDMIMEQYQSKLAQYQRANKQHRSQSFHSEFYAQKSVHQKEYYMNEQQIKEYHALLQQEHLRRKHDPDST